MCSAQVISLSERCLFKPCFHPGFRVPDAGPNVMMCLTYEFRAVAEILGFKICVCMLVRVSRKGRRPCIWVRDCGRVFFTVLKVSSHLLHFSTEHICFSQKDFPCWQHVLLHEPAVISSHFSSWEHSDSKSRLN